MLNLSGSYFTPKKKSETYNQCMYNQLNTNDPKKIISAKSNFKFLYIYCFFVFFDFGDKYEFYQIHFASNK